MATFKSMAVLVICVLLSSISFGMYDAKTGRFMQRDPIGTAPRIVYTEQGPEIVGTQGPAAPTPSSKGSRTSIVFVSNEGLKKENQRLKSNEHYQYIDGMNLYQYVISAPVNYIDPSGLCKYCDPENSKMIGCGLPQLGWEEFKYAKVCVRSIDTSGLSDAAKQFVERENIQHAAIVREGRPDVGLYPEHNLPSKEPSSVWTKCYPVYRQKREPNGWCCHHDKVLVAKLAKQIWTPGQYYRRDYKWAYNCTHWAANTVNNTPCLCTKFQPTDWKDYINDPDIWNEIMDALSEIVGS